MKSTGKYDYVKNHKHNLMTDNAKERNEIKKSNIEVT